MYETTLSAVEVDNIDFFSDVKIQDLKDSQKENDCKNVGCGEGRVIYKQPISVHLLWKKKTSFID